MMMPLGRMANLKESISENLLIIKTCLTTLWFWIPVLFAVYLWVQLGLMFYISPLVAIIVPSILIVYAIIHEDKRTKALYGLESEQSKDSGKKLLSDVDMKRLVNEYNVMVTNRKKSQDDQN
jgi:hypothetical protein